jgi:hypothetical protein
MQEFTLKEFGNTFRAVEVLKQKIMVADLNFDRSMQFAKMWIKHSAPTSIRMGFKEREKKIQSALLKHFERQ